VTARYGRNSPDGPFPFDTAVKIRKYASDSKSSPSDREIARAIRRPASECRDHNTPNASRFPARAASSSVASDRTTGSEAAAASKGAGTRVMGESFLVEVNESGVALDGRNNVDRDRLRRRRLPSQGVCGTLEALHPLRIRMRPPDQAIASQPDRLVRGQTVKQLHMHPTHSLIKKTGRDRINATRWPPLGHQNSIHNTAHTNDKAASTLATRNTRCDRVNGSVTFAVSRYAMQSSPPHQSDAAVSSRSQPEQRADTTATPGPEPGARKRARQGPNTLTPSAPQQRGVMTPTREPPSNSNIDARQHRSGYLHQRPDKELLQVWLTPDR
jgi:hypothetical protein